MLTHAFTCTGPYAVLIMFGIKRVENRGMLPEPRRGRCAVSCSKSFCKEEFGAFVHWASRALSEEDFELIPSWADVKDWPGKIVGACDYAVRGRNDLVLEAEAAHSVNMSGRRTRRSASLPGDARTRRSASPTWDEGYPYWWDLSGTVRFDLPIPCRGNVGMWPLPPALAAEVARADAAVSVCRSKRELLYYAPCFVENDNSWRPNG